MADKDKIFEKVVKSAEYITKIDHTGIKSGSRLQEDLGMDEVDVFEFVLDLEDNFSFDIPDEVSAEFVTVEDVVEYLVKRQEEVGL